MARSIWRMASLVNGVCIYMFVLTAATSTSSTSASKIIRTSAKSLAERAGAAQYAVHIEEELSSTEIGGERKQRRASGGGLADSDYEIYQGVVGRPGIDFPIQSSIPQTAFQCAAVGNGYFADLETKCQVFHICEGGKKISFLCPNGTIFQQTDLICDWWFRVNCASSPDYYADSSEILSRSSHGGSNSHAASAQQNHNHFKSLLEMALAANRTAAAAAAVADAADRVRPKLHNAHTFTLHATRPQFQSQSQSQHLTQPPQFGSGSISSTAAAAAASSSSADQSSASSAAYSAERFDVADLYLTSTKERTALHQRNQHNQRTSSTRKVAPPSNHQQQPPVSSGFQALPTAVAATAASAASAAAAAADLLDETQEVAESASFARSSAALQNAAVQLRNLHQLNQQQKQQPSHATQPIFVRSFQVENNETTITHHPAQPHGNGTRSENIKTNYNVINYVQSSSGSRSASSITGNSRRVATATSTTRAPASSIEPIYRRGSVHFASSQRPADTAVPNTLAPNQLQFTEAAAKLQNAKTPRRLPTKQRATQYYTPTVPTILARGTTRALYRTTSTRSDEDIAHRADPNHVPSTSSSSSSSADTTTPSDHAIEMMRILNELMVGNQQLMKGAQDAAANSGRDRSAADGRTLALYFATGEDNSVVNDVPFSKVKLDWDAAAANVGLDPTVAVSNITHVSNGLLSNATVSKYDTLFASESGASNGEAQNASEASAAVTEAPQQPVIETRAELNDNAASNDVFNADTSTPAIRSLAQVFTHALSAYLHDPHTFRQVLSEIRPTEPPATRATKLNSAADARCERFFNNDVPATANTFAATNADELEVLDFSDVTVSTLQNEANFPSTTPATPPVDLGERLGRLEPASMSSVASTDQTLSSVAIPAHSRRPTLHYVPSADHVPASRQLTDRSEMHAATVRADQRAARRNPLALEINGAFRASTMFPYLQQDDSAEQMRGRPSATTQRVPTTLIQQTSSTSFATTTDLPAATLADVSQLHSDDEFNLPLPNLEPLNLDDNDLQRSASASFVQPGNLLLHNRLEALQNDLTTTAAPVNANSGQRTTLAYTVFLDPLTINDELLQSSSSSTTATGSSVTPSLHTYLPRSTPASVPATTELPPTSATDDAPTDRSAIARRRGKFHFTGGSETTTLMPPPASSVDTTTTAVVDTYMADLMQERANEMFGGLNNTSAEHLMNVMRKANKNKTVRKLILLLIQTCDADDYDSSTVEQSRTALLNALIGMDGKLGGSDGSGIDVKVITPFKQHQQQLRRGKSNTFASSTPVAQQQETSTASATTNNQFQYSFGDYASEATTPQSAYDWALTTSATTTDIADDDDDGTQFDYATETSALFVRSGLEEFASHAVTAVTDDDYQLAWTTTNEPTVAAYDSTTTTAASPIVYETTTTVPQTTTTRKSTTTTTTQRPSTSRGSTRHHQQQTRRIVKDLDELLVAESSQSYDPKRLRSLSANAAPAVDKHSDTRALDLLRSLYTLAGKLGG